MNSHTKGKKKQLKKPESIYIEKRRKNYPNMVPPRRPVFLILLAWLVLAFFANEGMTQEVYRNTCIMSYCTLYSYEKGVASSFRLHSISPLMKRPPWQDFLTFIPLSLYIHTRHPLFVELPLPPRWTTTTPWLPLSLLLLFPKEKPTRKKLTKQEGKEDPVDRRPLLINVWTFHAACGILLDACPLLTAAANDHFCIGMNDVYV